MASCLCQGYAGVQVGQVVDALQALDKQRYDLLQKAVTVGLRQQRVTEVPACLGSQAEVDDPCRLSDTSRLKHAIQDDVLLRSRSPITNSHAKGEEEVPRGSQEGDRFIPTQMDEEFSLEPATMRTGTLSPVCIGQPLLLTSSSQAYKTQVKGLKVPQTRTTNVSEMARRMPAQPTSVALEGNNRHRQLTTVTNPGSALAVAKAACAAGSLPWAIAVNSTLVPHECPGSARPCLGVL